MALAYDDQIPAVSPASRQELVEAVVAAPPDESEPTWLEWKGAIDSLRGWAPRIGHYVLGFANRPVEWAQRHAGGWAYLLLGAEPGVVHGITPADTADLIKWIGPYLGTRGPQWDPHFLDVGGRKVLLIGIPPPRAGDPIFPVRRAFHGTSGGKQINLDDGEVIIRVGSETRRTRADELELLVGRAMASGGPQLAVSVLNLSEPFTAVDLGDEPRDAWLAAERKRLLRGLPTRQPAEGDPQAVIRARLSGIVGASSPFTTETRSPEKYREQVDGYIEKARRAWVQRVTGLAAERRLSEVRLQVRNETEHNFRAIELELYIPGRLIAGWEGELEHPKLPHPPESWGSRTAFSGLSSISPALLRMPEMPMPTIRSGRIDNSGSARITFDEFDLRPEEIYDLEVVTLVVAEDHAGQTLEGRWKLTSKSVSGTARGTLDFPVVAAAAAPPDLMTGEDEKG